MNSHPFHIDAVVILPDHIHALWTLPPNDSGFQIRWALIKAAFSRKIPRGEFCSKSRASKRERGIWQRRYWEHLIRDYTDYARDVDYIHYNPVKHGYAKKASDWKYSSIHRYIERGELSGDWGSEELSFIDANYGER